MGQSFHVRASARGSAGVTRLLASDARPVVPSAGDREAEIERLRERKRQIERMAIDSETPK